MPNDDQIEYELDPIEPFNAGGEVDNDEPEIEIVDDTPEQDRNKKPLNKNPEPSEEELEAYSEGVKKRINELRHGYHDERRAKEAALREREELAAFAEKLLKEKQELQKRYAAGEEFAVEQFKEKAVITLESAKKQYKDAFEAGDVEAMASAQEKMLEAALEKKKYENWRPQQLPTAENYETIQPVTQKAPQAAPPDSRAVTWAEDNKWFGADEEMTAFAYGVHDRLVKAGVDPRIEPDLYYRKIDERMREVFPDKFEGSKPQKQKPATIVAPVSRSTNTSKKVVLSASQQRVAKRLGLTPQQYAQELAKLEAQNG
jgi:hypothetical protein